MLKLKTTWRDGTTRIVMSPLDLLMLMRSLAALVPRPRVRLIRFYGVLTPNPKLRAVAGASVGFEASNRANRMSPMGRRLPDDFVIRMPVSRH